MDKTIATQFAEKQAALMRLFLDECNTDAWRDMATRDVIDEKKSAGSTLLLVTRIDALLHPSRATRAAAAEPSINIARDAKRIKAKLLKLVANEGQEV